MKHFIFVTLLSAVCGVSHAGNLVIDIPSSQSVDAGVVNFSFSDNAGSAQSFSIAAQQQKPYGFAMLNEQTSRYGKFNYLFGSDGSYAGDADYGHFVVGVKSTNMAPVPEPQTYAMMLVGLGLLGFSARRKKQDVM